jgi:hypothetical protein
MIFIRTTPLRTYRNYGRYRSQLRRDFMFRCAYCLTHERYLGGESGCTIDHHRPQKGPYARPDLVSEYTNLHWTCRECNENKSDTWPTPDEEALGFQFIDPCTPEGDHDLNWLTVHDGSLQALTPVGEYTIEHLMLWRDLLQFHRAQQRKWQHERDELVELIVQKRMVPSVRARLEERIVELNEYIEPPVFERARRPRKEAQHA